MVFRVGRDQVQFDIAFPIPLRAGETRPAGQSKVGALDLPGGHTAHMVLSSGTVDQESVAAMTDQGPVRETKECRRSWSIYAACQSKPRRPANDPDLPAIFLFRRGTSPFGRMSS